MAFELQISSLILLNNRTNDTTDPEVCLNGVTKFSITVIDSTSPNMA